MRCYSDKIKNVQGEMAAAVGNTIQHSKLIKETEINESSISETISKKDDTFICS